MSAGAGPRPYGRGLFHLKETGSMKKLHLICNAHLDPAWLWEIEEGAGEALSTFRIAADFCEEFDGFVFNHNEVILYKWVEEYDPELFERIRRLVQEGKWHIMGGWYLQPDCNMPSGESFVRQMLTGRKYFREKFNVVPTTAINFDPFGHTRGLVQIMKKAGFDAYIVCRPHPNDCPLPAEEVAWIGYDGSEVIVHRAFQAYLSGKGKAHLKVQKWLEAHKDKSEGLVLWGIGNHGGGPSRIDLQNLRELKGNTDSFDVVHSTPEAYFADLRSSGKTLPRYDKDLNPWAVGCYTSQIRIKQKHRQLENDIYMLEKMVSAASLQGRMEYPQSEINEAICDLMVCQFHDILPGSSIQAVEEASLRLIDHGLEILSRLRARAFFALTSGQPKAEEGEVPIFIYNPHPYKVKGIFECEFQLSESSKNQYAVPIVHQNGIRLPSQVEKECSNLYIDWRKRAVFYAELEPGQMNRFDCTVELLPEKPKPQLQEDNGVIRFQTAELEVTINSKTGLVDEYKVNGVSLLQKNAFRPIVIEDQDDSWGSSVQSFPKVIGEFKLMSKHKGSVYSGVKKGALPSVRVIEDGEARSVIEVMLAYGDSFICQTYKLPKIGTQIEVHLLVHWNEKRRC
jgi:alpha-mannosidase